MTENTVEGAPTKVRTLEAFGNTYELAKQVPALLYMKYAKMAHKGADSADPEVLALSYDMLRLTFTEESWPRFEEDASEARASDEDLLQVVKQAIEIITARPTSLPSDSSDGQDTTTPSSTESSSSGVVSFEEQKRRLGLMPVSLESLTA